MRSHDPAERKEHIEALTLRYVLGEMSEPVYTASLKIYRVPPDEIRHLVMLNQLAHRNSLPFKRGDVS